MTEIKRKILDDVISKISKAKYNDVGPILLQARAVLEPPQDGRQRNESQLETEKRTGKRAIWQSNIIELLADSLIRDYLKAENDWLCAAELCKFLVTCCTASADLTETPELRQNIFQKTSIDLWQLIYNIRQYVDWGIDSAAISRANAAFQTVCVSCHNFYIEFPELVTDAWHSQKLISMLEDKINRSLDHLLLDLCVKLVSLNQSSIFNLSADHRHRTVDATVGKLQRANETKLAKACIQFLVAILDAYPLLLDTLINRYGETLKNEVETWRGQGFENNINSLIQYISSGLISDKHVQNSHKAAAKIQATYRAYHTRQQLAKMKVGFIKLQQLFRLRRQKASAETAGTEEIRFQQRMARHEKEKQFFGKRLQAVSCIHASLVDQYLENEADRAATVVQAAWRGYWTRKNYQQLIGERKIDKAARIIQRHMHRWYEKRRLIKNRFREWPGLTESRRENLQWMIDRYQERNKGRFLPSTHAQKELHERAQLMLIDHYKRHYSNLNAYQKREATSARLSINIELLETAPKLAEVKDKDVYAFMGRSSHISRRANEAHKEELRLRGLPEWKRLLDKAMKDN